MKKQVIIVLLFSLYHTVLFSQTDEKLKSDVRNTGFIHSPLPLDRSKAFETFGLTKKVLVSDMFCDMEDLNKWTHKGIGEIPVGLQSLFNEDIPYWPQFNTATYKEVWGSSAGKWFSLISEF
jgi:hypothetical protein